ncbi:MAG: hypothetical protein OXE78_10555 [Gammaproteobacteria bacterium]|nr:hypothetical protein [Gammaproteobacteria bacterium]
MMASKNRSAQIVIGRFVTNETPEMDYLQWRQAGLSKYGGET